MGTNHANPAPFWQRLSLAEMNREQWESLCDGCGRCCLLKLEDIDQPRRAPARFLYTSVACKLLDCARGSCSDYANRLKTVPDCVVLDVPTLMAQKHWMPETCAYRRLADGHDLPDWHPLVTGDPGSTAQAGMSVAGWATSEHALESDEDLVNHLIAPFHLSADFTA